jgi:hypothetical protein
MLSSQSLPVVAATVSAAAAPSAAPSDAPKQKARRAAAQQQQQPKAAAAPEGAAAAARTATLASLVDDASRAEAQSTLLCGELHDAERELAWLAEALQATRQSLELSEHASQQHRQQCEVEHDLAGRLREELRARQEEQEALVSRLVSAQRVKYASPRRTRAAFARADPRRRHAWVPCSLSCVHSLSRACASPHRGASCVVRRQRRVAGARAQRLVRL